MDAFVTSWRARGFSRVTIDNDTGLLERTLKALGLPAWEVTPEDSDRVVGDLAVTGRAASTPEGEGSGVNLLDGLAEPSPADVGGPHAHRHSHPPEAARRTHHYLLGRF